MKVFVVVQEGVYRHAIGGVYTNRPDAEARANEMIDNYHVISVYETELDKRGEDTDDDWKPVYRTHPNRWRNRQ